MDRQMKERDSSAQGSVSYPMSGSVARKMYSNERLSMFEVTEVEEYEEVFYLARNDQKYKPTKLERLVNNGFDDQEGYYRIVAGD